MKKIFISMVSAAAIAATTMAMAGGPDNMAPNTTATVSAPSDTSFWSKLAGLYVGTDLGYANTPDAFKHLMGNTALAAFQSVSGATEDNDGFAFAFHAGYNFNPYIGAELGYLRLPKVGMKDSGLSGTTDDFIGYNNNNVYYLAAKGSYPVMDNLSVYAKAGYAIITSDEQASYQINGSTYTPLNNAETSYNPLVAAGAEYKVLPELGLNAQYMAIIGIHDQYATTHLVTAGLNYYF